MGREEQSAEESFWCQGMKYLPDCALVTLTLFNKYTTTIIIPKKCAQNPGLFFDG